MEGIIIKAATIKTPQQYYSSVPINKYCTCVLNKTGEGGAITFIDWDDAESSEACITQDISTTVSVRLVTHNKNKFCSHAYKCFSKEVVHSFYACNIFFDLFEEAQKEYIKLNLLWSIT